MLLALRSFVHSRIDDVPKQRGFLSSRAEAEKDLAEGHAGEIERALGPHVDEFVNQ